LFPAPLIPFATTLTPSLSPSLSLSVSSSPPPSPPSSLSLLCGHPPFYSETKYRPYIIQGKFCRSPQWNSLSTEAKDLIQSMLQVNPTHRISISGILKHEWLTGRASQTELGKEYADRVYKLALREKLKKIFQKWETKQHAPDLHCLHTQPHEVPSVGKEQEELVDSDLTAVAAAATATPSLPSHSHSFPTTILRLPSSTASHSSSQTHATSLSSLSVPPILPIPPPLRQRKEISTHRSAVTSHLKNSKRWFDLLDKDKDGSITREELIEGVIRILYEEDDELHLQQLQQERQQQQQQQGLQSSSKEEISHGGEGDRDESSSYPLSSSTHLSSSSSSSSHHGHPHLTSGAYGCPAVHVNVEELFLVMDRNCSGTIDYQEFTHFYDMILQSSSMKMEREYKDEEEREEEEAKDEQTPKTSHSHSDSHNSCETLNSFQDFDFNFLDPSDRSLGTSSSSRKRKEF
jgi:Ca2+-binding EF-hand superfamily protein